MTRKVKVDVELTARWKETLVVELPDSVTEKDAEKLVNQTIEKYDDGLWPENTEVDSWEYQVRPVFTADQPLPFPTDPKFLVRWRDHLWATTGVVAVREDVPCPDSEEDWIQKEYQLGQLLDKVELTLERPSAMRFQRRYAPILKSGRPVTARIEKLFGCAVLHEDGRLKAVVMPFRGDGKTPTVDCDGNP